MVAPRTGLRLECAAMNRFTILGLVVGLVVGVFIGYQAGSTVSPGAGPAPMQGMPPGMPPGMPGMPGQAPVPQGGDIEHQRRIAANQAIVARDPKNVQAWIQLGNDFYDTHQAQKAIEAYGRALELRPGDPDVLTDQGNMYRELGQYDQAVANFQKANQANPAHVQSLFNMGIVFAHDLKQAKKAIEAWERVIKVAPQSEQASQARRSIEELRAAQPK